MDAVCLAMLAGGVMVSSAGEALAVSLTGEQLLLGLGSRLFTALSGGAWSLAPRPQGGARLEVAIRTDLA
jgi:hypothetical protein